MYYTVQNLKILLICFLLLLLLLSLKAHALGDTGVLTGNSTCTTLGDPSKGKL